MDVYGMTGPDCFRIDDLLDLSNPEFFTDSPPSTPPDFHTHTHHHHHISNNNSIIPSQQKSAITTGTTSYPLSHLSSSSPCSSSSIDFSNELCVPIEDVAELEWLSQFVDDSFSDIPSNTLVGAIDRNNHPIHHQLLHRHNQQSMTSSTAIRSRGRTKRPRQISISAITGAPTFVSSNDLNVYDNHHYLQQQQQQQQHHQPTRVKSKRESFGSEIIRGGTDGEFTSRRCTHCQSEKTPQWRTGPMGPKTLCNACGVRFKSGRLVPEYRPAASPSFVLTQHSNSHRKVMELRRQKEVMMEQQHQHHQPHHRKQVKVEGCESDAQINGTESYDCHTHHYQQQQVC